MGVPPDATFPLILPARAAAGAQPSALELEVVGLFDQLRDRLLRYLLGFGLPPEDGEEIVQEVFLSLFQHLQRGKSRSHLRGWVFRVAHNLALKRRGLAYRSGQNRSEAMDGEDVRLVDPGPSPEDQAVSSQKQRRLLAVLRALPEQDQRCLALRAEGLRYREIAEVLEMSLGAVSISLGRSLARLSRAAER